MRALPSLKTMVWLLTCRFGPKPTSQLKHPFQSYPATIKHIPLIAGKFPKLKMVIDHIAKPHYMKVVILVRDWGYELELETLKTEQFRQAPFEN